MRNYFLFILTMFMTFWMASGHSAVKRYYEDAKFPTQKMIERQEVTNPVAATTNSLLSANAGNTSTAAVNVSTFLAQPDNARNLVITPAGTTADVAACSIVVTGTNISGKAITETFVFADNASTATVGAKAFKTISNVLFPANCEDGTFAATWSIGVGEKIGLKSCLDFPGHNILSTFNGAYESTRATMTADNDEIEKNTADFNGAMNGSNDFEIFFIQNYRCR